MAAQLLMFASAFIIFALGAVHLAYTFVGNKLSPRDADLAARMAAVHPVISRDTTMWKAWVGFNASHSLGALLFGLIYGYLAGALPAVLFSSAFLLLVGLGMLLALVFLAWRYWFAIPLRGIALSLACYAGSLLLTLAG